jgi:hypothetical protein
MLLKYFEMQHITEDLIQGILINEPYFIEDMSEGNSYHLAFNHIEGVSFII